MPCLKEWPKLPEKYSIFMKAFSVLLRTDDFSIANIREVHNLYGAVELPSFIEIMLSMKTAHIEATSNGN